MDDAPLVGCSQTLRQFGCNLDGALRWQCAALELVAQTLAFEQLHHSVGKPILCGEIEYAEHVRMRQRRHGLGLTVEARQQRRISRQGGRQHLDCHQPV